MIGLLEGGGLKPGRSRWDAAQRAFMETPLWEWKLIAEFLNCLIAGVRTWRFYGQKGRELGFRGLRTPCRCHTELACPSVQAHIHPQHPGPIISLPRTQQDCWGILNIFPMIFIGWLSSWLLKRHKWSFLFERGSLFTVIRYLKTLISRLCWT